MKRAWIAATLAASSVGCVPSLPALVQARRYDDAVCHASTEAEAKQVAAAIERDADVRLHLYAVHAAEARPVLGDKTTEVLDKITLLRAKIVANDLPARPFASLTLSVDDQHVPGEGAARPGSATAALMFDLTGEKMPGSRTVIDADKVAREAGWALVTLGMKQLLFGTDKLTHEAEPSRGDLVRAGPKAMSIYDGVRAGGVDAYVIPRSVEDRTKLSASLSIMTNDEDSAECTLTITYAMPLGQPSRPLTESIDQRFGGGVRRPRDLDAVTRVSVQNVRGRWSW